MTMKRRKAKRKTTPRFGHASMPRTLGKVPVVVRSLRCVGGVREGARFVKKANNRARRAGYPDAQTMMYALAKAGAL